MLRVWGAALALSVSCVSARAADTFAISIERQPLAGALQQLARQCDVQMIFFSRVTEGLSAPALEGSYTLPTAMERLLLGSGLTFTVIDPKTIEVRPPQARPTAKAIDVPTGDEDGRSRALARPLEEVVVVGLAEQLVATRIPTPLREIPQTIAILSGEQMRQRNVATLADVLTYSTGITMVRGDALDQDFYARGFPITSFHIDGGAAFNPAAESNAVFFGIPDLIEFDHVEVLRGADGLLSGNADPGGTISLIRKRPQRAFAANLSVAAGSWGDRRIEMDLTGPLAFDGALRGRTAAVLARDGFHYDIEPLEKRKVFAALELDLTSAATLTAGFSYQWDEASGLASGLPFYGDGRDARLPRDTTLQFDWDRYRSELRGIYVQYRHDLAAGWTVKLNGSSWRTENEAAFSNFLGFLDPNTHESDEEPMLTFSRGPALHTQDTADLTITGTLDWFGWREEVAFGGDFTRLKVDGDQDTYFGADEAVGDIRSFDAGAFTDPRNTREADLGAGYRSTTDQYGAYASLRVYFDDAWSFVGGARMSKDTLEAEGVLRGNGVQFPMSSSAHTDPVVTPYAGLMYAFDQHYSLYASYADIYRAQRGELPSGRPHGPIRGVNMELGIKSEWRNGKLNGSLAAYRIEQSNIARAVPASNSTVCCHFLTHTSTGLDAELSGELLPAWNLGVGYTYNVNESADGGDLSSITPKHLLKIWSNMRLPGSWSRAQIGGGLHAQTATQSQSGDYYCTPSPFVCVRAFGAQPAYVILDVRAAFDIDPRWQVALGVNNVLDKTYYESIELLRGWYGPPRSWTLRLDARF